MSTRFVKPSTTQAPRLNTFMDTIIALLWTRDANVPTTIEGKSQITQAAEAYVISVDLDAEVAIGQGTTLVFPQVLQQTVRNNKGQYVLGRLTSEVRENGRSLTTLEDLTDEEMDKAIALIESASYFLAPGTSGTQEAPSAPTNGVVVEVGEF